MGIGPNRIWSTHRANIIEQGNELFEMKQEDLRKKKST